MGEPASRASNLGDAVALDPASIADRRRRLEARILAQGIRPLTTERLDELGTGGPWKSDEEFEAYLAAIYESR